MKKNSGGVIKDFDLNDPKYQRFTEPLIVTKDTYDSLLKCLANHMTVEEFVKDVDYVEIQAGDIEKFVKGFFKNK